MTELCQDCGVVIDTKPTGRPPKYCEPCFKKHRKKYQVAQWVKRKPTTHNRIGAKVPGLLTVKGKRSQLEDLIGYHHSARSLMERNLGGSGYSETMPSSVDKSPYLCRLKVLKTQNTRLYFHLDFTSSKQHILTEQMNGTDIWCWYGYEFNRLLRLRRMNRVSVE